MQTLVFSKVVLMLECLGAHITLMRPLACYITQTTILVNTQS